MYNQKLGLAMSHPARSPQHTHTTHHTHHHTHHTPHTTTPQHPTPMRPWRARHIFRYSLLPRMEEEYVTLGRVIEEKPKPEPLLIVTNLTDRVNNQLLKELFSDFKPLWCKTVWRNNRFKVSPLARCNPPQAWPHLHPRAGQA